MLALSFFEDPLTLFLTGLALMLLFFWYFATEIERRKRNVGTVLLVGVVALCVMAATPPHEKLKGGIDILGGSSFSLRIQEREDDSGNKMPITVEQVDQAIMVIEKRLNSMGTTEPLIARQGENGILVQMPGVEPEQSAQIRETLEKVAKLELREVSPRNDEVGPDQMTLPERVEAGSEIVPGYRAYKYKHKDSENTEVLRPILLSRRMALGGSDIANATPSPQQSDAVSITLNRDGTDKMIALTKDMRPGVDRIAIVLDGEVISAPVVNQVPLGRQFIIEGLSEPGEVQGLASALMNPLENPLVVDEERTVSPTLGSAIVKQGITAGLLSLAATFIFVLLYYRTSGVVAILGLIVNGIVLFGVMAMFGFTFSLPGIAGMILTIGMAVDANVLIYERLREEIATGKSLKNAIDAAYDKAFTAIFDANITSLITAVILFWLGSGAIKGFAVTLTIGLISSMFSAILVTRVLFRWGIDLKLLKKLTFLNLIKSVNFDFMGKRRIAGMFFVTLVVLSLAAFATRQEKALGIDFTGGTRLQFQMGDDKSVTIADLNKALEGMTLTKAAFPQEESNLASGTMLTIRCATEDADAITAKLRETIPALAARDADGQGFVIEASKEEVSALIGGTFLKQSVIALIVGLVGIMLYMTARFEFSFALGGMVAILHDITVSLGIIVMLGGELSLIHVGAILTIAGYSINDTIIVFDRIRETLLIRTGAIKDIMNEAINATLSRTLLTSTSTLMSVAILGLYGGAALRDFGLVIFIGIIVGTFSSIFVAAPVVLWWSSRKGRNLHDDVRASAAKEEQIAAAP